MCAGGGRRPRMDEQRRAAALERLEHGAQALEAGGAGQRAGRDAGAGEPAVEQSRERRRVRLGEADRGPGAERGRERRDAVVVGLQQRLGLAGRERLDAERDGGRHQRALEAVGADERRAALGVVVGEVDGRLGLAAQAQHPAVARRSSRGGSRRRTAHAAAARATGAGGCRSREATV